MGATEWTPDDTPLDAGTRAVRRELLALRLDKERVEQLAPLIADSVIGNARPSLEREIRHDALCWVQPDDSRLVACDRARGHKGRHSWDAARAIQADIDNQRQVYIDAGRADERQRIRQAIIDCATGMGYPPEAVWGMAFTHLADFVHDLLDA